MSVIGLGIIAVVVFFHFILFLVCISVNKCVHYYYLLTVISRYDVR